MMLQRKRVQRLYIGISLIVTIFGSATLISTFINHDSSDRQLVHHGRKLLQEAPENCTPRSIDEFPADFMTLYQRQHGGIVFHIFIVLYIFAALAIVCDDYFVTSLEQICNALSLQPDVAGATFMAAGSSAPELFTSIIGVFFAKSDVGLGTIVGSAVFNILFIIAICGLFSGMVIYLTWWPLFRDSMCYLISVIALVAVMFDNVITWYESLILVLLYFLYIVLMYFNPKIGNFMIEKVANFKNKHFPQLEKYDSEKDPLLIDTPSVGKKYYEHGLLTDTSIEKEKSGKFDHCSNGTYHSNASVYSDRVGIKRHGSALNLHGSGQHDSYHDGDDDNDDEEEYQSPFSVPNTIPKKIFWVMMLPMSVLYFITIPDCRRPGCWQKTFVLTFIMSIVWIAGLSYIMVWMVTIIGDTLGIPDTVMGLTFLAAGTSVPDAMASLFVARDGYGDMAVSNSIGSNVFDILLCLGLPWLLQTTAVAWGTPLEIESNGIIFTVLVLFATVVFLVVSMLINGWKLNKKFGVLCLVVYAVVIMFSILYELNIFTDVNLPVCPRTEP